MEMKETLKQLREKNHLTQEQMAERLLVTRQAIRKEKVVLFLYMAFNF